MPGDRSARAGQRDRDVGSFDRRACSLLGPHRRLVLVDLFAIGWLRPVTALGRRRDRVHTASELEAMLARARLAPLAWKRVFDLGPLRVIWAVVAARAAG